MDRKTLLTTVTALPHAARFKALREAGLESQTSHDVAAVLDAWEHGDWQERLFCVQSCTGSFDAARLCRMIDDPSRTVAGVALKFLADFGSDEELLGVLQNLTHRRRQSLLKRLRRHQRFGVIDRFLDAGFAVAAPRIGELLANGSAAAVQKHFSRAAARGGLLFWQRLSRRHARFAVQAVLDNLADSEQPDPLSLRYAQEVVQFAGRATPEMVVRLVGVLARFVPLVQLRLSHALSQRANEFAEIVLESDGSQPFSLLPVAQKLDASIRLRILREQPNALSVQTNWLRKVPASERLTLFQEFGRSWQDSEELIPRDILALLPARERTEEAARMVSLPIMATRPQLHVTFAGFLIWEKMREIVDRILAHPEGEWRGWGWAALLTGLRYRRNEAAGVLAMIRKRKFEQDPVRLVILQNLTALPAGIWQEQHLVDVAGIIREALDATDLSPGSVMYLTAFVQKLIPAYPQWAAQQLVLIYRERGNIGGLVLESRINDELALTLETAFLEVGKEWGRGNRVGWLFWFASALGRRLRVCTRLMNVLEQLLGKESGHYDASIVDLLRQHLPYAELERLTKYLISSHESWAAIRPIFEFLHRYRQDWLEPLLSKFSFLMRGGTRIELVSLLPESGYERYTLKQQSVLAKTLNDLICLPAGDQVPKDVWTMLAALRVLALLPAIDANRLIELSNDARPVIAEAAMRALGRLDGGQGVPILIAALGDQRARVAIYALRRALMELPPQRVVAELQHAPLKSVTVAKETVRLVGELGGAAGFEWLLQLAKENLHRDVHIAVLRGLWDHLEHPETWAILKDAARSVDGQILNGVVRIPADRLSEYARRELIGLLTGLASHSDALIRLAVLQRFIDLPLPDTEGHLLQAALSSLTAASTDERALAAEVIATNAADSDAPAIAAAIAKVGLQRRHLYDFVRVVSAQAATNAPIRSKLAPIALAVIDRLRPDPITAGVCITLAASILGVEGFEQELKTLHQSDIPIAAIMTEAIAAIEQFGQVQHRTKLPELEARLAAADDTHLRLLAFHTLLVQATDHLRWNEVRRDRLQTYRHDPAPLVAIRAQFFFDADASL